MNKTATIATISIAAIALYAAYARRKDPAVYRLGSLPFSFNAMTVPPVGILVKKEQANNELLLNHEREHWRQFQQRGMLGFYHDYFSELAKYGYDAMPMEQEARFVENEYCKCNYTECVRSGKARTVQNQKFISI